MGCDTYLPRAVAINMNEKEEHFIVRVLGLLRGMWPTDLKVRSLKGPDDDNPELVKIPTLVIKSIQGDFLHFAAFNFSLMSENIYTFHLLYLMFWSAFQ